MSTEENKRLVRRYVEEVVNTGNVDDLARFLSPDYIDTHDRSGESNGLEGARRHILGVRQTYPDLRVTVEQQIAEGEWVVSRVTARGTHRGTWLGMKPTGKAVEITGVNIDRVVGGRIVEHGGAANLLGPLLEIGAIRVVGDEELSGQ
jgi:predicted ester cyclase